MKTNVKLNGEARALSVTRTGESFSLRLTGGDAPREWNGVTSVEVEPGVYSILMDGRSYRAAVEAADGSYFVSINGRRIHVEIDDPRRPRRGSGSIRLEGQFRLVASMPGKVVRVLVREGERVTANQGLVVVEAMKMQNELKSPKDGLVLELPVREGHTLATGDLVAIVE